MRFHLIPIAILVLIGFGTIGYVSGIECKQLCVSKQFYEQGDTIVISGKVDVVLEKTPIIIQIFFNQNLVEIVSVDVSKDGSFTHTVIADGPYFQNDGTYTVKATYGVTGNVYETSFDFQTKESSTSTTQVFEVNAGSSGTFDVPYTIRGGTVENIIVDPEILGLIVIIQADNDGSLLLDLGRQWVDAKKVDGTDDTYIILIDGLEVPYQETTNANSRLLTIQFLKGASDIKIIGTKLIGLSGDRPNFSANSISVFTDSTSYDEGDVIVIDGKVAKRLVGIPASLFIYSANGNLVIVEQVDVKDDNTFGTMITAGGALWKSHGTYTIKALYGSETISAKTTFYYNGGTTDSDVTPSKTPPPITVYTDNRSYAAGDIITIFGAVRERLSGYPVSLQIIAANGNLVIVESIEVSADKTYETKITETDGALWRSTGTYTAKVIYGTETRSAKTTFEFESEGNFNELPQSAKVNIPIGSSTPGCENNQKCYEPYIVSIAQNGQITWVNSDSAAHTVTSGTLQGGGPDGIFDSSLMMSGKTYQHKFEEMGEFPYFCVVHPWMVGIVLVGEGSYMPPQPEPTSIHLDVITDNSVYDVGNNVRVSITTTGATDSQSVGISITNPSGSVVISRSIQVQNNFGEFEFKIPEDFKAGTYRVDATLSANGQNYKDSTFFKIISQFNQVRIISVDSTDQQGNPAPLRKGEMGFVKVVVSSDKIIAGLVTVNLFDSDLTSIGIGSVKSTFNSGQSELILSFMIPGDVVGNTADIYVNIFTDWPSQGGVPFTSEVSKQVLVN